MATSRAKDTSARTPARQTAKTAKARKTPIRLSVLAILVRPRLRWREILIQSSAKPTRPAPSMTRMTSTPDAVNTAPVRMWAAR